VACSRHPLGPNVSWLCLSLLTPLTVVHNLRYAVHFSQPGIGVPPSAPRQLERQASQTNTFALEAHGTPGATKLSGQRIFSAPFSAVYPMYVQKAARKGRSKEEADGVICWLTGHDQEGLQKPRAPTWSQWAAVVRRPGSRLQLTLLCIAVERRRSATRSGCQRDAMIG
jgi:Uncharacterized protein conserved in bacteria (DUF2200)